MFKRSLQLLLFACLGIAASWGASSPFVGDWKLNPSKSKIPDQMKVESLGGNKYTFNFGGGPETIVVDGTDQPSRLYSGGTLSVAAEGDTWKVVRKKDGRTTISAIWSLSKDGSTLTDHFTGFNADGSAYKLNYVYKREAEGTGFAGTWVSTGEGAVNFVILLRIRPYEGNGLSILNTSTGNAKKVKFDGKDYRRVDERTLDFTDKNAKGEILDTKQLQLSPDLKTLTMTTRLNGQSGPQVLVFERQ